VAAFSVAPGTGLAGAGRHVGSGLAPALLTGPG
jgi:hypothetical protein